MASEPPPDNSTTASSRVSRVLKEIRDSFQDEEESGWQEWTWSEALALKITTWDSWFWEKHALGNNPEKVASEKYWDIDFRIFFLAYPFPGSYLLRLVEACYEIDKAMCGMAHITSKQVEKGKDMDPLLYLMSEDLISLWKMDLCQLQDDIDNDRSSRLACFVRVQDIGAAADEFMDCLNHDFWTNVITTMEENGWPAPYKLQKRIEARESLVSLSLEALRESVQAARKRGPPNPTKSITSDRIFSTGFQDQARLIGGEITS
jgi:hypothetical protein